MLRVSVVLSVLFVAIYARTAYICNVQLPGYPDDQTEPTITLQGHSFRFIDTYNAISFGGFYSPSGDVEGRAAVKGNVNVNSYSFGYEVCTSGVTAWTAFSYYALVAGGNVNYGNGAFYPQGNSIPYPGQEEYMYVGGTFTGPQYFTQDPMYNANSGNMDAAFNAAQAYYVTLSNAFAAVAPNANAVVQSNKAVTITCNDASASSYSLNINANDFNTITSYNPLVNCASGAQFVINVIVAAGGDNHADFSGDSFPLTNGVMTNDKVLYNIVNKQSSAVVNINTEVRGSILAPQCSYNQPGEGVAKGIVIAADFTRVHQINTIKTCKPPVDTTNPPTHECPAWEGDCAGFNFDSFGSFKDFNAVVFGDFTSASGDIEGRLAVQGSVSLNTYSVGYQIDVVGTDRNVPFALVVNGDLTFTSGAVYPQGNGIPFAGQQENIAVHGNVNAADYLAAQVTNVADLTSYFNAAQSCYTSISNTIASQPDNVQMSISDSAAVVTCNDASSDYYYLTVSDSQFSTFTYWNLGNCNFQAYWYINVVGTGDVDLTGASFPAIPAGVVYNVVGSGRTINVHDTALTGHLLAPNNILNQPNGVIQGKVVAGSVIASLQINRENTCPASLPVPQLLLSDSQSSDSDSASLNGVPSFQLVYISRGQNIFCSGNPSAQPCGSVASIDGNNVHIDFEEAKRFNSYNNLYFQRLSTSPNVDTNNNSQDSSASFLGFSVFAAAIAALFL